MIEMTNGHVAAKQGTGWAGVDTGHHSIYYERSARRILFLFLILATSARRILTAIYGDLGLCFYIHCSACTSACMYFTLQRLVEKPQG
jgi:hypothetical protein